MADHPSARETDPDLGEAPDRVRPPRMPGWVTWPAIIIGILVAVLLVLRFFGVEHGPGQHTPGGDNPPAGVTPHTPRGGHG